MREMKESRGTERGPEREGGERERETWREDMEVYGSEPILQLTSRASIVSF